tara:strand:+ start:189 stop:425 length:237 start_codon:yes stop_codon:yes gene_type:complete
MRIFLIISLLIFSFAGTAYSYTQNQMDDFINNALINPATKSISKSSLTNYCDCALKAIFDENKDIRESGYECALKNFN